MQYAQSATTHDVQSVKAHDAQSTRVWYAHCNKAHDAQSVEALSACWPNSGLLCQSDESPGQAADLVKDPARELSVQQWYLLIVSMQS